MSARSVGRGPLKRLLDSKFNWDVLLGPFYNRYILALLDEIYQRFSDEVQPPENARILDVGCGPGHVSVMLAEGYPTVSVTGIDYSPTETKAANRLLERKGTRNCRVMVANAMDLPFEDGSFDVVVSTFSIKHWPDEEKGLREMRRVLAHGGRVVMTELDKEHGDEEFRYFYDRVRSTIPRYLVLPTTRWFVKRVILARAASRGEVEETARSVGFSVVHAEKYEGWPIFVARMRK